MSKNKTEYINRNTSILSFSLTRLKQIETLLNDKSLSKEQIYKLSDSAYSYRQRACFRRCDADMAEDAWRERRHKLAEQAKKRRKKD